MAGSIALTEKRSRRAEIQALWEQRRHTTGWLTEPYNKQQFLKGERIYPSGADHPSETFLKGERTYPSGADHHSGTDYLQYTTELMLAK